MYALRRFGLRGIISGLRDIEFTPSASLNYIITRILFNVLLDTHRVGVEVYINSNFEVVVRMHV